MRPDRRKFIGGTVALGTFTAFPAASQGKDASMYGLIGKFTAAEGRRDELIAILLDGLKDLPGCLSYIVAKEPADANTIWVTEVWVDEASHKASLSLPPVQAAIAKGRPLIAGMENVATTQPVGGQGLSSAD